jgi:hypothetical protein
MAGMHHIRPSKRFSLVAVGVAMIVAVSISTTLVVGHNASNIARSLPAATATATNLSFAALAGSDPVGADFAAYVQAQGGTTILGQAITPELPDEQQVTQIYQAFMLQRSLTQNATIIPQPIVSQLIQVRAAISLVQGGKLTYADLVKPSASTAWVRPPKQWQPGGNPAQTGIFVPFGTRAGETVGHYIPPLFASFLIKLKSWQALLGEPITEDLTVLLTGSSQKAHIQAFADALLVALPDVNSALTVSFRPAGLDWLTTFGRPELQLPPQHSCDRCDEDP